jgi:hypothetical protein
MKGCLLALLTTIVVGVLVLWFSLPLAAGYLIQAGIGAAGFHGTDTKVEVKADPPLIILTGHADSVHLTATDVSVGELQAGRIDLRLDGLAVLSRHIESVHGTFDDVEVLAAPVEGGNQAPPVAQIRKVTVEGPSNAAAATIVMTGPQAAALAQSQLRAATGAQATLTLAAPDVVNVTAGGNTEQGHLVVQNGSLQLVAQSGGFPTVTLLKPGKGSPFYIKSAVIGADSEGGQILTLTGSIDIQSLLD